MNWDWLRLNIVLGEGGVFLIILAEPDSVPFFVTISPWALSLLLAVSFKLLTSTLANLIGIAPVNIRTSDCTPSAPDEARTHVCTNIPIQGPLLPVLSRACHPMAPDTAHLPTGPAPHSGPASLGIVQTLILGLR